VRALPFVEARLGEALKEKSGLTHFLPARVEWRGRTPEVKALRWQGSGDIHRAVKGELFPSGAGRPGKDRGWRERFSVTEEGHSLGPST